MASGKPDASDKARRLKIAFIKRKRFSHINAALRAQLERCFPEYELEEIDIFRDFICRRPDVVLRNFFAVLHLYGHDILRRRRQLALCFYRTPYIFREIRKWLHARIASQRANYAFSFATQSLYDASVRGLPHFVYTDHTHLANLWYPHFRKESLFAQEWIALETEIYRNANCVFVPGEHVLRSLREQYDCTPGQTQCVHAGINFPKIPADLQNDQYGNQTIVFVGVDWERKGGPELIAAFSEVRRKHPNARLIIVGCSPAVQEPGVHVAGRVPIAEVSRLLSSASVFCLPSRIEPFGIAVLEAFAARLPAVVTRVGALGSLVSDGETGYVVEAGDSHALAERLSDLLSNPEKCRQFGELGHRFVQENGTWEAVGQKIRDTICAELASPPLTTVPSVGQ